MPCDRHDVLRLENAEARRREVARDAVDAGGVGAVRRQIDLDDRIVEPGPLRIDRADRRVLGQFDDAVMLVGKFELGRRSTACRATRRRE